MADCPHTIGVEFGTRIIEVIHNSQKNTHSKTVTLAHVFGDFFQGNAIVLKLIFIS